MVEVYIRSLRQKLRDKSKTLDSGHYAASATRSEADVAGWWHNLSLRKLLIGAFVVNTVLALTLMAGGVWWMFRCSINASAGGGQRAEVEALWNHRPAPPYPGHCRPTCRRTPPLHWRELFPDHAGEP